jgi:signal transduction histidine kinase
MGDAMQRTAEGDLCTCAGVYGTDEVGGMAQSLDHMVLTLSSMVADIRSNAALVAHAGQTLAHGNRALAERTVQQAEALQSRASTLSRAVSAFRLQQGTAQEAVALVGKAVALHKTTSRDAFLRTIIDKSQPFHDRDMDVFALDTAGAYLAFGGNPAKVGTRVQDIPGIAGDQLISDMVAQADRAPGWVEYDITNPATGAVQTKMSFVARVGDLYLGCGVYKSLAAC